MDRNSGIANQIREFYAEILKRKPNEDELKNYLVLLEGGNIHVSEIPSLMKNSDEYKILKHMEKVGRGPIKTNGITMYLNPKDKAVSYYLSRDGMWEPFETELMKKFFNKTTNFIDIGAHIGYYALICASVANQGSVLSFEPEEENYKILKENITLNNFENVIALDYAISNKNDTIDLYLSNEGNTGDNRFFPNDFREITEKRKQIKVKCITLDSYLLQHKIEPDVIKMDIQGSEFLALQGMEKTIKSSNKLVLFTEFWPHGIIHNKGSPEEFLNTLSDNGFEIYDINQKEKKIEKKSNKQLIENNLDPKNPEAQTDLL
ncbi:MAG: FkbM family methyltransferase [Nitrosotalea sp.]